MSPSYCKKTPVKKMGFSQRSSCKAQGFIKRSDGKKRISPKYKKSLNKTKTARKKSSTKRSHKK